MRNLLVVALLAGCSDRTELVLGAATDLKARNQLDEVKLTVQHGGKTILEPPPWSLADVPAGKFELPGSFGLYSPDGSEISLDVTLVGSKNGEPLITRRSILSLVAGKTLFMRMTLVSDCSSVDGPGCPDGQSCVEGVCRDQKMDAHTFPRYQSGMEKRLECQSGFDYVVTSTGEPMPVVGDCGPGATCQEGTCYTRPDANGDGDAMSGVWSPASAPNNDLLHAIWQTPDGQDLFAVGDGGTILHLHEAGTMAASSWIAEDSPLKANLFAVWGTSVDDVYAAGTFIGEGGILLHRSMGVWTQVSGLPPLKNVRGIAGTSSTDLWLVGTEIVHWDGTTFTKDTSFKEDTSLRAVAVAGGEVWVAGTNGVIGRWDGAWTTFKTEGELHSIVALGGGEAYAVGQGGVIAHVASGRISVEKPVSVDLFGLAAHGAADLVAVGDYGTILRLGAKWLPEASGTRSPLFAVWSTASSPMQVAVGSTGTVLTFSVHPCTSDDQCPQGRYCTDGVCCNQRAADCQGCMACNLPSSLGTCAPVEAGTDPRGTCANATGECQQTTCNGAGSCGTSGGTCGTPDCAAGMLTSHTCDKGVCVPVTPAAACPGVLACADAHSCAAKCAADSECDASAYCNQNGDCAPRKDANGTGACNPAADCKDPANCRECKNGLSCVDGFCCTSATCGGTCQSCALPGKEGTCSAVPDDTLGAHGSCSPYVCSGGACSTGCNPGSCAPDAACYNIGGDGPPEYVCEKNQGASCTKGDQCRTNICSQGKCCDTQCNVFCTNATMYQAPSCATGTCTPGGASAACPNHLTCLGSDACGTSCLTVWIGGYPSSGFPTGLYFSGCAPGYPYCNCIPGASGGNCNGTKCCATFPCN